jgi:hypothetical protein
MTGNEQPFLVERNPSRYAGLVTLVTSFVTQLRINSLVTKVTSPA